jgi:hypothetical protein
MKAHDLEAKTRAEVEQDAAVSVPHLPRPWPSRVIVMAQVVRDQVVIIEDITDKPLVDALVHNAAIPRDKIILAYKGEQFPDALSSP